MKITEIVYGRHAKVSDPHNRYENHDFKVEVTVQVNGDDPDTVYTAANKWVNDKLKQEVLELREG